MNFKKSTVNTAWFAAIAVCLVLSVFAVFFTSCTKYEDSEPSLSDRIQNDEEDGDIQGEAEPDGDLTQTQIPVVGENEGQPSGEPQQPQQPQQNSVILGSTADAGREYLDKFVFLGDSTTYGIGYYYDRGYSELCPPSQIWTPSSGTLTLSNQSIATVVYPKTGEEIPIIDAVTDAKPQIMLLTLGVNGVSFMDETWFVEEYTDLINNIKAASPDTKIILNSIYPVAKSYPSIEYISNEKIVAANGWIQRIAEETGCKYLNTYEVLVGADGALPEESHNGDGIHLSGESFEVVMEYIRTHAYN